MALIRPRDEPAETTIVPADIFLVDGALGVRALPASSLVNNLFGTTTNDNATAGNVGEYQSNSVASGSALALSTGVTANLTSVILSAGDWDVWGQVLWTFGATTNATVLDIGLSTSSATFPPLDGLSVMQWGNSGGQVLGANPTAPVPPVRTRFSLSATTTVFLVVLAAFTVSTAKAFGSIQARRVR